jgi:hypothetical protein
MNDKQIRFCLAKREDIPAMVEIEQEFFGDYEKAFDEVFFTEWFMHNPDMFYVIKDGEKTILGFVILTPVTEKLYNQLLSGEVFDFFDFPSSEVTKTMDSDYYYVSDICITKRQEINYLKAVTNIVGGMMKVLSEKAKYITTCPVTPSGAKLCKTIGMRKVAEVDSNGKKYTICALESSPEKIARFQRLMDRVSTVV